MEMKADLFFDLDRTLWDFDRNSREALEEIFLELAIPVMPRSISASRFIQVYEVENEKCWRDYREGKLNQQQLRPLRFQRTMEGLGFPDMDGGKELAHAMGEAYVQRAPFRTQLIPDALDVVKTLASRGHRMFILTNGFDEVQHMKMQHSGLGPYFEKVFTSDALGYKKPHPRAFECCLEQTDSSVERAVMIGDDLECDVVGAKEAGWRQVHFNPKGHRNREQIWRTVTRLTDILALPL